VFVRPGRDTDAEAAARLMRRSISQLCTADHHCDAEVVRAWLANKRPAVFREWLARPQNIILVAEAGDRVLLGVAAANRAGEITLNYVSPEARFTGVSLTLIADLERRLKQIGLAECRLASTITAHEFYLRRGYLDDGPTVAAFGIVAIPMRKPL
jgi:GNAT superfamily N-acetyltransferase